ncbi:hypothetical protein [Marinicrinis lubricantis]|uniref:TIGR04255 family protein n=1 Tax=Marinicrinis lubricantis TaxID=2086470 RepID=A0ABW1IS13_9BACL
MFPSVSLNDEDRLNSLLEVFSSLDDFIPTHWGHNEKVRLEYNQSELVERVKLKEPVFSEIYLEKNDNIKYSGRFQLNMNFRSFLEFDFRSVPKKHWASIFKLCDEIAQIVKPRYGISHMFWPSKIPWETDRERMHRWMNLSSQPAPVNFGPSGPLGISARTYFSGEVLGLFNEEFLQNIPANVEKLDWGGIRIDIVDKPWEVDADTLLDQWLKVMQYFEESQVIALPNFNIKDRRSISFSPNAVWKRYIEK